MTLIELLIAMTVMAIGIAALVAGFSSGILAVNACTHHVDGGHARGQADGALPAGGVHLAADGAAESDHAAPAPDGHTYWMQVDGDWTCAIGTYSAGPPASCSGTPASRPVKLLTITVRDGSATGKVLFTESATFDASTG